MSKCAIIVSGGTLDEALAFETLREYEEPCARGDRYLLQGAERCTDPGV